MFTLRKQNNPCGFLDSVGSLLSPLETFTMTNVNDNSVVDSLADTQPAPRSVPRSVSDPMIRRALLTILAASGLGVATVGLVRGADFLVGHAARLTHVLPSTADARGSCSTSQGHNAWSERGHSVYIPSSGWCANLTREEYNYLLRVYPGAEGNAGGIRQSGEW